MNLGHVWQPSRKGGRRLWCSDNPSQAAGRQVFELLTSSGVECSLAELEVSRVAVRDFYACIPDKSDMFVLHIGLAEELTGMTLEQLAHNTVDFSIPDRRGDTPRFEEISADYRLGYDLENPVLDVPALQASHSDGFSLSRDPGTYICNYAYFYSLLQIGKKIRGSLFVHVPQLTKVPLATQVQRVVVLAKAIIALKQFQ
jgi:pyrrolidone-carboxylate peptidase